MDGMNLEAERRALVASDRWLPGDQILFVSWQNWQEGPDVPAAADGTAVMIGDAAYTSDIYRDADKADLSRWPGQHSDREEWTNSLHKLHGLRPRTVHFCHDTQVVTAG